MSMSVFALKFQRVKIMIYFQLINGRYTPTIRANINIICVTELMSLPTILPNKNLFSSTYNFHLIEINIFRIILEHFELDRIVSAKYPHLLFNQRRVVCI
jgi:hypothetical protein